MFVFLVLFSLVLQAMCEGERELLGVDTKHIINKDTIITRNLKLGKRNEVKKTANEEERAPDWSYASIPDEVTKYVEQFKKNMSECLKEVHSSDRKVQRLSPRPESPVHGDCVIACVLKRNQIIVNKKVHKDNLINLVNKFYAKDTKLMKKLEKNLDSCIAMSAHHRDDCDLAAKLNDCTNDLMENNKHKLTVNY